jgi:hypothetical protein
MQTFSQLCYFDFTSRLIELNLAHGWLMMHPDFLDGVFL